MDKSENDSIGCLNECESSDDCNNSVENDLSQIGSNSLLENSFGNISNNYNNNDSFNTKNVIIYESFIEESNNDDSYDYIDNNSNKNTNYNIDQCIHLDINQYEHKIRRLSAENETLNDQLIRLEEQIIDLINDKQNLNKSLKSQKEYNKNKIEELTQNLQSLEKSNIKLEEKLNQKNKEKAKLELRLEEIEDKLLYSEFQLSEALKNETELRMSYKLTKDALSVEECDKYEAIHQLHDQYLQCASHENEIIRLKEQVDVLKKEVIDKDNELWFLRTGDRSSIGHDISLDVKTSSNESSPLNNKLKHSNSGKSSIFSDKSKMDDLYEKLSDVKDKEFLSCEVKTKVNDSENVEVLDEEIKATNSSLASNLFPSLPDVILRKLQLLRESCCSIETLTEQEIESKFTTLSLAFKTDKFTLEQRLSLQKHQRDVAEQDALNELQSLRDSISSLQEMIFSSDITTIKSEINDLLNKIESQVEVIGQTNAKISSRSELYGAVKQEERVSSAFDVILIHTENLKRSKEKYEKELEETKKLLNGCGDKKTECESDSDNEPHPMRRSVRSISTTVIPKMNLIRFRRASVSSIEILPNNDTNRRSIQNTYNVNPRYVSSNSSNNSNRSRRRSMPASPALFRPRFGSDVEMSSQLEITTEEKGGSESDYASSVANQESDDEQTSHNSSLQRKISEDDFNNAFNSSLIVSEPSKLMNSSVESETFSHSVSHQNSIDNSCDEEYNENTNSKLDSNKFESHTTIAHLIEYRHLANLFNFCFNGRLSNYVKGIVEELRFMFAIILLIIAVIIVMWSLLPTNLPCECHCYYSFQEIIDRILMPYLSKEKVSRTQ